MSEKKQADRIELGPEFADALRYAYELHARQNRKADKGDPVGPPYIGHLLAVAGMVIDEGGSEAEAIAALLHDAAEDQGGEERLAKIEHRFGPEVAGIVRECSDTTALDKEDWKDRKGRYIDHFANDASPSAVRVSLADKLYNARAIVRDHHVEGDEVWKRFSASKEETVHYYRR